MTCDDVLPALELGDAARRQAARNHARTCPACTAAVGRWSAVKSALAATPALTDRDRALWRDARSGSPSQPRVPRAWLAGAALAAGVGVALLWPRPVPEPEPSPAPPPEVLTESPERVAAEFAAFDRRLDQLDGELAALENRIAVADARRTAAELAAEYRQ